MMDEEASLALDGTGVAASVAPAVARRAVQWWLALQGGDATAAQLQAWQRWRAEEAEHERAWQRIEAVSGQLAGIPPPLASAALAAPAGAQRRRAVRLLTALVVAGGSAAMLRQTPAWQSWNADASTATGERRTVRLPDGGTLVLNTDSAIQLRYDASERAVQLLRGEVLLQTAPDAQQRPFRVHTADGTARALGTRFIVRQHAGFVQVGVLEGAVELRPAAADGQPCVLRAGEEGSFTRDGVGAAHALDAGAGAWADGMLVAAHMRLDDFLLELSRHRRGHLGCDPALAHLLVSGAYPLADTDRVLLALVEALPVELHYLTRYWVTLRPRAAKK
ncbi:FecR domain-containing protein [Janthinobacterium sp. P210005]|uniref:FecR domain-containing protein n=1 Tax=Janthinobacterium sp. P210005 TaxID=3112938 RepID=UPI002E25F6BC|nr:FecR domain-containing protein [Janthinobacterium sp. P210005]